MRVKQITLTGQGKATFEKILAAFAESFQNLDGVLKHTEDLLLLAADRQPGKQRLADSIKNLRTYFCRTRFARLNVVENYGLWQGDNCQSVAAPFSHQREVVIRPWETRTFKFRATNPGFSKTWRDYGWEITVDYSLAPSQKAAAPLMALISTEVMREKPDGTLRGGQEACRIPGINLVVVVPARRKHNRKRKAASA